MPDDLPSVRPISDTIFCDVCRMQVYQTDPGLTGWINFMVQTCEEDAHGFPITHRRDICPACLNLIEEAKLICLPPSRK